MVKNMNYKDIVNFLSENEVSFTVPGCYGLSSDIVLMALKELEEKGSSNIISLHRKWTYFCWRLKEKYYNSVFTVEELEEGLALKKFWDDDEDVSYILLLIEELKIKEQIRQTYKFKRKIGFSASLKKECLKRDNFLCVKCNSQENLEVDHIVELVDGGENDISNLQTLCTECHKEKTRQSRILRQK